MKETKNVPHLIHLFLMLLIEYINIWCIVLESLKETETCIQNHIKESLYGYSKVVKRLNTLIDYKLFNRIAQILQTVMFTLYHIYHVEKQIFNVYFLYNDPLRSKKTVLLLIIYPKARGLYGGSVRLSGKTGNCIILSYFFSYRECFIVTTNMYSNDSYIRLLEKHNKSFLYLWI